MFLSCAFQLLSQKFISDETFFPLFIVSKCGIIRALTRVIISLRRCRGASSRVETTEGCYKCKFIRVRYTAVFEKYFCKSNRDPTCRAWNGFTGDLVLTVHSLDRAFQITRGTITGRVCSERTQRHGSSRARGSQRADATKNGAM